MFRNGFRFFRIGAQAAKRVPLRRAFLSTAGPSSSSGLKMAMPRIGKSPLMAMISAGAVGTAAFSLYNAETAFADDKVDWKQIRKEVEQLLEEDDNRGPTIVRLAWHASGTYDAESKTGGSNAATMRFPPECNHGANAGLIIAREWLKPIRQRHPEISHGDLWTLAGVVAIESMGGPQIEWRPGRIDKTEDFCTPDGRLPDADKGSKSATIRHVHEIFGRMGFTDRETVALIGAHALGQCYRDRSGYQGPWTRAPTTFSNEYFRELVENTWTQKNWKGPLQYEDPTGDLMMLPADMALLWDPSFRQWVELYAKDEEAFFKDFSAAFKKLVELGVDFNEAAGTQQKKKGWWPF